MTQSRPHAVLLTSSTTTSPLLTLLPAKFIPDSEPLRSLSLCQKGPDIFSVAPLLLSAS